MVSNSLFIVLGNQLFPFSLLKKYKKSYFYMAEDFGLCTYEKHHKLKISFFLSSMREYRDILNKNNFKLDYVKLDSSDNIISYEDRLLKSVLKNNIKHIFFYEVEDKFFEKRILNFIKKYNLNYTQLQSPMFLNTRLDFADYLKVVKKPLMASFYKKQRIKKKILVNFNGTPVGGKWSFDEDNRKKIPNNFNLPKFPVHKNNKNQKEVLNLVTNLFKDHPGSTEHNWLVSKRSEVKNLVNIFIRDRLKFFGDFEDAVIKENIFLFHSLLSPYLNNGLITPGEVLDLLFSNSIIDSIPLNSLEGFIRQIIGWREFIRGIYQNFSSDLEVNYFGNKRKLTKDWYTGNTGIEPIDDSIKSILKYGYAHHIVRLMYLSNIMNLSGIEPKEIYRWFMEMFVDSSDWVMAPNVYGMGTFSDGGIFSTKPYICGSNYIIKMSNYKKGEWSEIVDGLYWNFIAKNFKKFENNPRMSIVRMSFNRLSPEKLLYHKKNAAKFIKEKTL